AARGVTASLPDISVGAQYAAVSPGRRHDVVPPSSELSVENASVESLPMKVWSCDFPGCPGNTIGSSVFRWLTRQPLTKLTPRSRASDFAGLNMLFGLMRWAT